MPHDPHLADLMRPALAGRRNIVEKKMFGGYCWMLDGNMHQSCHTQTLSLHDMAGVACLSRFHFVRHFGPLLSATLHAFLTRKCALVARRLQAGGETDAERIVYQPDGKKAGENLIEPILGGCALRETWQGRGGFGGTSLNSHDPADGRWHQTWVDNQGGRRELSGRLQGRVMVLSSTGPHPEQPGKTLTQRIAWTPADDGSVRQLWETPKDGGATWSTAFDGKYVKRP